MLKPIQVINLINGGIAESEMLGYPESVANAVGLDLFTKPGFLRINHKLIQDSVLTEKINRILAVSTGDVLIFCDEGKIYKAGSPYTLLHTVSPSTGSKNILSVEEFNGYVYFTTSDWVHRIAVSKLSSFSSSVEENWASITLMNTRSFLSSGVASFDGIDDHASASTNIGLSDANDFTFSCWFKTTKDVTGSNKMAIWSSDTTTDAFTIKLGSSEDNAINRIQVSKYNSGTTIIAETKDNAFLSKQWNHLLYTYDGSNSHIYINGKEVQLDSSTASSFSDASGTKYIGTSNGSDEMFSGQIVDILFLDGVISSSDVENFYKYAIYNHNNLVMEIPLSTGFGTNGSTTFTASNGLTIESDPSFTDYAYQLNIPTTTGEKIPFIANQQSIERVMFYVSDIGTGDLTISVLDEDGASLGSITVANGDLNTGVNYATFSSQIDLNVGNTYYLQVTASTSDIYLNGANYNVYSDIRIFPMAGSTTRHSTYKVNNRLYIGERNYIHQVNVENAKAIFTQKALDINQDLEVSDLSSFANQLIIGTQAKSNIAKTTIIRWDTWSVSYNSADTIDEEGINAFIEADNILFVNAGKQGNIYAYNGNYLQKVGVIAGDHDDDTKCVVNANASVVFNGIPMFGVTNALGSPSTPAIWSYHQKSPAYRRIFNIEYPLSLRDAEGNYDFDNIISIDALEVINGILYVGYSYDDSGTTKHAVDKLDTSNRLEKGYFDTRVIMPNRHENKFYKRFIIPYKELPSGTSIGIKVKTNYGSWSDEVACTNDAIRKIAEADTTIQASVFQVRVILHSDGNNTPVIESLIVFPDSSN